jgi:hypothetical protein
MNYKIEIYSALCSTRIFNINGIDADSEDFGEQGDDDRENAEQYACANMTFTPKLATDSILKKYKITNDEYNQIAEELSGKLSFGRCGWCV